MIEHLEREPTTTELAEALGIEQSELLTHQLQVQARQLISLDEIVEKSQGEDHLSLTERLPDPHAAPPDAEMISAENKRLLLRCLIELPKTQATVIELHYLHGIPLRNVAERLSVTPSRVSQLHGQALGRMRQSCKRMQLLPA